LALSALAMFFLFRLSAGDAPQAPETRRI
jgi:hypothetical protein